MFGGNLDTTLDTRPRNGNSDINSHYPNSDAEKRELSKNKFLATLGEGLQTLQTWQTNPPDLNSKKKVDLISQKVSTNDESSISSSDDESSSSSSYINVLYPDSAAEKRERCIENFFATLGEGLQTLQTWQTNPPGLNSKKKVDLISQKVSTNDESSSSSFDSEKELYLISDRESFTNQHEFSTETQIVNVELISSTVPIYLEKNILTYKDFELKKFSKRKILILIHGFTVKYENALKTLRNVANKAGNRYDAVIGYLYPACAKFYQYNQAKENGLHAAEKRLPEILHSIRSVAERVDIVAHSMGTIVAMHALNQSIDLKIDKLFLLGGALEEKSIFECDGQGCTTLKRALSNAKNIYVLYSCNDKVLPWLHVIDSTQPLGRLSENIQQKPIAKNVCLINTTSVVKGHSAYFQSQEVFKFIYDDAQGSSLVGTSFSLTLDGLSSSELPIVCSKGKNNTISGGFSKKFVAFKFGGKKARSKD
ncbi:alpha/beta hydrolase [Candidatus Protochlamydia sp. R18]|uniref:alpha/beta hydrolase n=2 Tax=Candidatus Protochlamydia sp. R18 TaxID=1353977 RepID=UPI0005A9931B|nr:alpha/beta hydrolase [Candidatus Protochlamydia sp. R18]